MILYSLGLGTKMSLLLALPAIGLVIYLSRGLREGLQYGIMVPTAQFIFGIPFLYADATAYVSRSFELTREFMYEWTVNWRFVDEDIFYTQEFSNALLLGHLATLYLFIATRWLRPAGQSMMRFITSALRFGEPFSPKQVSTRINAPYITTVILTANAIGFLFARSLHYQFFAYIALATPYLMWRAKFHPILQYILWGLQEWAWNVFPSTVLSSQVVVMVQLIVVVGVWFGTRGHSASISIEEQKEVAHTPKMIIPKRHKPLHRSKSRKAS